MNTYKFSSPGTGLEFEIHDDGDTSYIVHAITGERIPMRYNPDADILLIPGYALRHFELLTVKETTARFGVSKQAVHKAFSKGNIKGVKIRSLLLISATSAEEWFGGKDA